VCSRFLSIEPLIGPIGKLDLTDIDWVIVGGESGPGARPMKAEWVREVRDQCEGVGVAFFFFSNGEG
jgi:protein gp37